MERKRGIFLVVLIWFFLLRVFFVSAPFDSSFETIFLDQRDTLNFSYTYALGIKGGDIPNPQNCGPKPTTTSGILKQNKENNNFINITFPVAL